MRQLRALFIRLLSSVRSERDERDLEDELASHLEMHIEDKLRAGMTPQEARRQALSELGGLEQTKEIYRDRRGLPFLESFLQDLGYGLRQLKRNPGFTAVAVLTLGLGIGANTTIFSVAWRPMRYQDADRLLMVWESSPEGGRSPVSGPTYLDWRDQNKCFQQLAAARISTAALSGTPPTLVSAASVTANFFETFRLRPALGRFLLAADFRADAARVAVLGHDLWQTHFGGDAAILGKWIRLNGEPTLVVGVAPADFEFWGRTDVWTPLVLHRAGADRQTRNLMVVGRMKPGVTAVQVQEEMRTLAARIAQQSLETSKRWSAQTQDFHEALAGPGVRLMLALLLAVVGAVLLMACANVANLLLARGTARQKEIALRIALGAGRWRVIRQLLVETLLLAFAGGTLGLLLAFAAVRYLATLPVLQAPGLAPIEINGVVLGFAAALSIAATFFSGLIPAWRTTPTNLMEQVNASGRTALGDRGQSRIRHGLVVAELAWSVMLMVTAGLSVRSFIRLTQVNPGFPIRNLLTAHLSLPAPQYADAGRARSFYSELLEKVRALPGVDDAAISTELPPMAFGPRRPFTVEGRDAGSPAASGVANYQVISPGYFHTLGQTLLKGRGLTENDREGLQPVAVINQRLAEKYFASGEPIGQRIVIPKIVLGRDAPSAPATFEIVGVVENVKNSRLSEPATPEIYLSYLQAPQAGQYLVVRSKSRPESLAAALRDALRAVDPDLPLTGVATMEDRFSQSLAGGRIVVALMTIFAFVSLAMGGAGLYGVISYSVARRTNEFAVRMALGASRREIFRLVGRSALRLLLVGGALGLALAVGAARLLGSVIFGISPYDPLTFTTVAVVLLAMVFAASYLPARRASKVDPMVALRYE
jgi:predicted permease